MALLQTVLKSAIKTGLAFTLDGKVYKVDVFNECPRLDGNGLDILDSDGELVTLTIEEILSNRWELNRRRNGKKYK